MQDLNSGLAQILEEISDLAAQRKITENEKYHFTWMVERARTCDEVDRELLVSSVRSEIRKRLNKAVTFEEIMGSRQEQVREKKWQNKIRQDRRGKVK